MAREYKSFSKAAYAVPTAIALYLTLIATLVFNQYALSIFGAAMLTPTLPIWGAVLIAGLAISMITAAVSTGLYVKRLRDSHRFLDGSLFEDEKARQGATSSDDFKHENSGVPVVSDSEEPKSGATLDCSTLTGSSNRKLG